MSSGGIILDSHVHTVAKRRLNSSLLALREEAWFGPPLALARGARVCGISCYHGIVF
jgi:hypothetical protein